MKTQTDIDIDCANREEILKGLEHVCASMVKNESVEKHNTGVYFQRVPCDAFTNQCTVDYKVAEDLGYFKIDLLNVSIYKDIKNEAHLISLINQEPNWELLQYDEIVKELFHIGNYSYLTKRLKPTNIEQLAAILAIIRPAKKHLQKCNWDEIMSEVWKKEDNNEYHFKRSHAFGYAMAIVVQMNLLAEKSNLKPT